MNYCITLLERNFTIIIICNYTYNEIIDIHSDDSKERVRQRMSNLEALTSNLMLKSGLRLF
jgi:hypothetical protein